MNGITLIYITNRKESRFWDWFLVSLIRQKPKVPIQIVLIDYWKKEHFKPEQLTGVLKMDEFVCDFIVPDLLPSPIQGEHRLTGIDWFSAGNARNTGFTYAKYGYVVFADDLSVLMPGWLDCVIDAANGNYCVLGTYEKRNDMVVEGGLLVQSTALTGGMDHRWFQANYDITPAPGSWFFGCSFGMPLDAAINLNGFDHVCDCIGTEDTQFGMRLKRTGLPMYFDKRMKTIESAELHFTEPVVFKRSAFTGTKEHYFELLGKYGIGARPERAADTYDAPWFILDLLKYQPDVVRSMHNTYDLAHLRAKVEQGGEITVADMNFAERFWWDGNEFKTM